jgi:YfiH family protein
VSERATVLELPGARVAFSTRNGGVSAGPYESLNLGILTDDETSRVAENRELLAETVALDPGAIAMGWQVHGTQLREWDGPPPDGANGFGTPGAELPRVDGHLTDAHGVGLLVLVADCLPVALSDGGRIAMLHCGWRGLGGGIVAAALERFESPPAAAIGPGIGPCCYEVGDELLLAFGEIEGAASGRMLDLRAIARQQLRAGGVEEIIELDECTSCNPDSYFSHRRDEGVTGRQCGLVWRA